MDPEAWFDRLADELEQRVEVGDDERTLLLDLARVAAHTSERWTAPVSTWIVGAVLGSLPEDDRVARLRDLVATLDDATPASEDGEVSA
ncbi:MAG: DUF6457 domain-containing protein [Nitriliruptoraceae bacterium]